MKKLVSVIITLCLLCVGLLNVFPATASDYFYADYAYIKPIIDGEIDEVWETTAEIETEFNRENGFAYGHIRILWDEDTLYVLALVVDSTVDEIGDDSNTNLVNFWVSETASDEKAFGNVPGDWHLGVNQAGKTSYYCGEDLTDFATCKARIDPDYMSVGGYVVEAAIPLKTSDYNYSADGIIGFAVSIDDDVDGDNVRDSYCATQDPETHYWSVPANLNRVELFDLNKSFLNNSNIEKEQSDVSDAVVDDVNDALDNNDVDYGMVCLIAGAILGAIIIASFVIMLIKKKQKSVK